MSLISKSARVLANHNANMGMIQAGNGLRFAFEALFADRIARNVCRQNLDCHCTLKPRVAGAIYLAHPAPANRVPKKTYQYSAMVWCWSSLGAICHALFRFPGGSSTGRGQTGY